MSRLGYYVLCGVLCSFVVLGQGEISTQEPIVIPISRINSTTEVPTTPATTPEVPTTHKTTTIAPPSPPKPSPSNTTTTTTTTTTPAPPSPAPKPTPPPPTPKPTPPPPTPKPTPPSPLPPPSQGTWSYEESNVTCIVVQFAARLNVTYTKAANNSTSLDHYCLNVPANASVIDGSCSALNGTRQWMTLSWAIGDLPANNMTLVFLKNGTNYSLQNLNVSLTSEIFPNASTKNPVELFSSSVWQTPLATSYRCGVPTDLNLTAESAPTVGTITISQLQEEAFRTSTGKAFSAARDCGSGDVPDAVPIAVGCALGGMVVVVLVAYLVARHRSAARGYLSM